VKHLGTVTRLKDLIDPKTGEYYTGEVHADTIEIILPPDCEKLPVNFGELTGQFTYADGYLTSLEGTPRKIGGSFYCDRNQLTSLHGAPAEVNGYFSVEKNSITSLEGVHKIIKIINGAIYLYENPIKSGGIGLLLIEGLSAICADQPAFKIINKYLGQGKKGLLYCQDELIEAGYEEYARL
jgi:hypothetical protein